MLCKNPVTRTLAGSILFLLFAPALPATAGNAAPLPVFRKQFTFSCWSDTLHGAATKSIKTSRPATTVGLNRNAVDFVAKFLKKEEEFLVKMKRRSSRYFQTIENVFEQYSVPSQLKYLAVVESELRTDALSGVGARGLWQLMPVTARELGLRVAGTHDERTHAHRSTVAAAKYLHALYKDFGDWLLVLAAYNGGPGTVYKAMKKAGSKNFWALQRFLPAESRGHVKRFIGVHFYFEGQGSVATQTAAEAKAHREKIRLQEEALEAATNETCLQ